MSKFITFEGPEGSGKSTVISKIQALFPGQKIMICREPGSTSIGEKIRAILQTEDMPDRAELMLFESARACVVDVTIKPALKDGFTVICDRFYDSTIAYQGYGRGLNIAHVSVLNDMATQGLNPDLTILFDVDPVIGMARRGKPTDRIESAGMEFHNRVRNGYLEIAKRHPERFVVIDASKTLEEVVESVTGIFESKLEWKKQEKDNG